MSLYHELKRRNVFRVAIAYLAGSWLLVEVAETIFPLFGFDDTPARIMVIVLAIGFPLFLLFSWVFEITPEGLKKEKDIDRAASVTHKTGKQLDRIIIVLLALALGYFAFDKFVLEPARVVDLVEETAQQARSDALVESYGDQSIAVLPFVNMSADPEQEYFSDGISEELLNLLVKIPELRVISRSSAFVFKGEKISIPEVAKKLNVAHILEGSVRKAGNQVRITVQLIEARSDTHLWSETYDRRLDDIFAIQDEIAGMVVAALKLTLLGDAPMAEEIDPRAYTLYLQARHIINTSESGQSEQAEQKLRQALEMEPAFIPALWELGRNRIDIEMEYREPSMPQDVTMIRELIERMAAIAPDSSWTNYWRAWDAWKWQDDYQAAAQYFEYMIAADPYNPESGIHMTTHFLMELGRQDEAYALAKYEVDRDPACTDCLSYLAYQDRLAGRHREAADWLERTLEWHAPTPSLYWNLGVVRLVAGEPERAMDYFEQLDDEEWRGNRTMGRLMALYELGRYAEFEDEFARVRDDERFDPEGIARLYAWAEQNDEAFRWLDEMVAKYGPASAHIVKTDLYARLHADPRWLAFLEKHGATGEEYSSISFDPDWPPEIDSALERERLSRR
jgi:TolB-like protein/Tfp pilus assembly protein PilF